MEDYSVMYKEGYKAAQLGLSCESCPYPERERSSVWWNVGFDKYFIDKRLNTPVPYDVYYY